SEASSRKWTRTSLCRRSNATRASTAAGGECLTRIIRAGLPLGVRDGLEDGAAALDDHLELDVLRLVLLEQLRHLGADARGHRLVADAVGRLAAALAGHQIGVVEAAQLLVGDVGRLGRRLLLLRRVAGLAQLGLEDVALVGALLHLAQGAVPHALEGDEL